MTATAHDATDLVLGVDLGGTKTLIGLVDSSYRIHHREKLPTSSIISGDLSPLIQALLSAIDWAHKDSLRVSTIGLGIAGVPDQEGVDVLNAPNLGQIPGSEIGREIASVLGVPVIMENDVNLGALGEQRCGIATGVSDLVYISVGTGLGVGLINQGEIVRGSTGGAGEVGSLRSHLKDDSGQRYLTFEELLSGPDFARRGREVLGRDVRPKEIISLAESGDPAAQNLFDEYSEALAALTGILCSIADPELLVLGGGLGSNKTVLLRLRDSLARRHVEVQVETGSLGNDAALIGARVFCEGQLLGEVTGP